MTPVASNVPEPKATPLLLFLIFARIGLTSFGGGLSGWLYRVFVLDRKLLGEEEFLNGLSLSQAMPGMNVTNMAIWIGHRLSGAPGAFAAFCGIVLPPAGTIVLIAIGFDHLSRYPLTNIALMGAAAASIGLSLSMGITTARRLPRQVFPIAMAALTFVAVGILRLPLHWVVLVAGVVGVAFEYVRLRKSGSDGE
jgi:chromate transporter